MDNLTTIEQMTHYNNNLSSVIALSSTTAPSSPEPSSLLEKLQVTLALPEMLTIFAQEAAKLINFCGLSFHYDNQEITTANSVPGRQRLSFNLSINNNPIGQLIYNINSNLTRQQLRWLDVLHNQVVYPFRNAISYNKVLKLALIDSLTSIGNRCHFDDMIERNIGHANRHESAFSLMVLDLDEFKQVNDSHGHQEGDEILKAFANILKASVRGNDMVFRLGGDEFTILLDCPKHKAADALAARIQHQVAANPIMGKYGVSTSIGCAHFEMGDSRDSLFARADEALYSAKALGKNCTQIA
jgi:diguanylate cyclase (GGDEF)-like protein